MRDLLMVPELEDTNFALTDISERNLHMVKSLAQRDIDENKKPAVITATTDRKKALEGADAGIPKAVWDAALCRNGDKKRLTTINTTYTLLRLREL